MHLFQRLKCLTLFLVMRRLCPGALLRDHLAADVVHILLVIFFELFIYLALDAILQIAPCEDARDLLRHAREDLGQLCLRRRGREQRILLKDAHECEDALTAILRSHECHCIHLARLDD